MKKTIVGLVIGAVLGVGTWFLLANSHADFFDATATKAPNMENQWGCDGMTSPKGMISLMYLEDGYDNCYDYELSGMGWGTAVLVIGLVPLGLGMLIGKKVVKS